MYTKVLVKIKGCRISIRQQCVLLLLSVCGICYSSSLSWSEQEEGSQNTWAPLITLRMVYLLSMDNSPHIHCLFSTLQKEKVIIITKSLWSVGRWNWYKIRGPDMKGIMYIYAVVYSAFCFLDCWCESWMWKSGPPHPLKDVSVGLGGKGHGFPLVSFPL